MFFFYTLSINRQITLKFVVTTSVNPLNATLVVDNQDGDYKSQNHDGGYGYSDNKTAGRRFLYIVHLFANVCLI